MKLAQSFICSIIYLVSFAKYKFKTARDFKVFATMILYKHLINKKHKKFLFDADFYESR